jgi:putative FmdB family regulatory protein
MEALQKISDEELKDCPDCEQPKLKKLMSAAGFRLKGGGWYETDFKKDNQRNLHDSAEKKGSEKKTESAGKSDKKSKTESGKSGANKSSNKKNNQSASAA